MALSTVRSITLLMLCCNLMLLLGGFQLFGYGDQENFISRFATIDADNNIQLEGTEFSNQSSTIANQNIGAGIFDFFNPIAFLFSILLFLINLTFAPIALFVQIPNLPQEVALMLGVPMAILYILSIFWFIRGLND